MRYYEGISKAAFKAWISNFQILTTIKNESSANIYLDYCQERVTELHEASWSFYSSFPEAQKRPHGDAHTVCADQLYVPEAPHCEHYQPLLICNSQ